MVAFTKDYYELKKIMSACALNNLLTITDQSLIQNNFLKRVCSFRGQTL